MPCLKSSSNGTEIECFDEKGALIHGEEDFTRDILVPKYFAMLFLNTLRKKVFCNVVWRPCFYFKATVGFLLFFVCLFPLNVGHASIQSGTVLAPRVVVAYPEGSVAGRGSEVGDVLVDNV